MKLLALGALLLLAFGLFGCPGSGAPINEGMTPGGRAYRGADSPKIVIYEYSDFECPFCSKALPSVDEVLRAYPNDVQLQFRHYPLPIHPQAYGAAIAAVCAEEQDNVRSGVSGGELHSKGKFWSMHDKMFANQGALFDSDLKKYAADAGLDAQKFEQCLGSASAAAKVNADMSEAALAGIQATPTFKIGESLVKGAQPFSKFKQVIDSELARAG